MWLEQRPKKSVFPRGGANYLPLLDLKLDTSKGGFGKPSGELSVLWTELWWRRVIEAHRRPPMRMEDAGGGVDEVTAVQVAELRFGEGRCVGS